MYKYLLITPEKIMALWILVILAALIVIGKGILDLDDRSFDEGWTSSYALRIDLTDFIIEPSTDSQRFNNCSYPCEYADINIIVDNKGYLFELEEFKELVVNHGEPSLVK